MPIPPTNTSNNHIINKTHNSRIDLVINKRYQQSSVNIQATDPQPRLITEENHAISHHDFSLQDSQVCDIQNFSTNNYLTPFGRLLAERELDSLTNTGYAELPEEKKQFLTPMLYRVTLSKILTYTNNLNAIDLTKLLIHNSSNKFELIANVKKYTSLYSGNEDYPLPLISLISKEYDKLSEDYKIVAPFGSYSLAAHTLLESLCISTKYTFNLLHSIALNSSDKSSFFQNITQTLISIQDTNDATFKREYKTLDETKKTCFNASLLQESIKRIQKKDGITYTKACSKVMSIANKADDLSDFNLLMEITMLNAPELISADELKRSPDISFSKTYNYTQTCWYNSVCKHTLKTYGYTKISCAIDEILATSDNTTSEGQYSRAIFQSLKIIFTDLNNNKAVNIQISHFFKAVYNYTQQVANATNATQDATIKSIYRLIQPAFANPSGVPDFSKIDSQDAEDFYLLFSDFLRLNNKSNTIISQHVRKYCILDNNLRKLGLYINQDLTFDINSDAKEKVYIYQNSNDDTQEEEIHIKTFVELLNRAQNSSMDYLSDLTLSPQTWDPAIQQIPAQVSHQEKLLADIESLEHLTIRTTSYNWENNQMVTNIDKTKNEVASCFPFFSKTLTDESTQEQYDVDFKAQSIIMRRGKGTAGHYFLISIRDSDTKLFINNDSINASLEDDYIKRFNSCEQEQALIDFRKLSAKDQLLAYIEKEDAYPVNISFVATDKKKVSTVPEDSHDNYGSFNFFDIV